MELPERVDQPDVKGFTAVEAAEESRKQPPSANQKYSGDQKQMVTHAGGYQDAESAEEGENYDSGGEESNRGRRLAEVNQQEEQREDSLDYSPDNYREEENIRISNFFKVVLERQQEMLKEALQTLCGTIGGTLEQREQERKEILEKTEKEKRVLMQSYMESVAQRESLLRRMTQSSSNSERVQTGQFKEPMPFEGNNPREWLLQMQQYYDLRQFDEATRLRDAPFYLRGDAHMFYYTTMQQNPERLPKTWKEFELMLIKRFSARSFVETLQRLSQIRYKGSVADVTREFARICAEGDPLPNDVLLKYYLACFPKSMVERALRQNFTTWVEASDFFLNENRDIGFRLAEWYQLARPEWKRECENDPQCQREGWMIQARANSSKNYDNRKTNYQQQPKEHFGQKGDKAGTPQGQRQGNNDNKDSSLREVVCHGCKGRGHRIKECPSRNEETRKSGQRCHKCGGADHWASSCPSPKQGKGPGQAQTAANATEQQGNGQA